MTLHPCSQCRRHVRGGACVFCGADVRATQLRGMRAGRLSRAAVFAGAIAAPACWRAAPTPPQAGEHPVITPVATTATTGSISGVVTSPIDHTPLLRVYVTLHGPPGQARTELTDERGRYRFADLPPGDYTLEYYARVQSGRDSRPVSPTHVPVTIKAVRSALT